MCAPLITTREESIGVIQLDTLKKSVAFSDEDLEILVTVAMQASLAIQKLTLFEETERNRKMEHDLKLAHEVQQAFLPQQDPAYGDYEFFAHYRATNQVGGDYYDYISLDDDRVAIIVADVVGHGIAAALLMAKVSAEARFALATSKSALEAVQKMNASLSGLNLDRFVTLVMGLIDRKAHELTVVNAGHMPPIVRRKNGEIQELVASEASVPLGIFENAEYLSLATTLEVGDVVVMYTDGIHESMNSDGNLLGIQAIIDEIKTSQAKSASAIGKVICQLVSSHVGSQPPHDDRCLVCFGRTA
jgi:serine phosphatase RsbU (regulator of sigma subunit)